MKKNIFLYFIILITVAISITGFFIFQQVQSNCKTESEENLIHITRIISSSIDGLNDDSENIPDYDKLARHYAQIISEPYSNIHSLEKNIRITFIATDGKVIGDSATNYKSMENHLDRQEVQDALLGKTIANTHYSSTLKMDYMYSAKVLDSKGIIIRVSMPLKSLQHIRNQVLIITLIGILAGLFLAGLLAFRFSCFIAAPIDKHIQDINKELYKTLEDLKDENIKMDAILNSMRGIIIAVDSELHVININSRTTEFFSPSWTTPIIGRSLIELVRNKQINDYVISTIAENKINEGEIHISSPCDRILKVTTAPINTKEEGNTTSGGIIIMEDITNLKKLEQIRTEFVSNVTHELKTPLTSIKGFIETLKSGAIENKEIAYRFLDIIDIEAERLTILINDILNLSEIETKQEDSNISEYSIDEIIEEIVPMMEKVAVLKNIQIHWNIDSLVKLEVNKDRIKQILINLIDNAVKYNVEDGQIYVKIKRNSSGVEISVRDTGIGIAEENLSRIFERFYRVDKGRSRSMGGTGLGLSIVKHIVNLYNGIIKVNSEIGTGTEFIIILPI